jgi:hypothetical protein
VVTGEASADVHHRAALMEQPAVVTPAVLARDEQRTNNREADLAAVDVAGQEQVDPGRLRPRVVVRRVAQPEPERLGRAAGQVRHRAEPRRLVADDDDRHAVDLHRHPPAGEHLVAALLQALARPAVVAPLVVVAEDGERPDARLQPAERR